MKNIRKHFPLLILLFIVVSFTSCCPAIKTTNTYGFFWGIWHGIIFPFSLLGQLFQLNIGIYALNNVGFWYWLGYCIGFFTLGGSFKASGYKRGRFAKKAKTYEDVVYEDVTPQQKTADDNKQLPNQQ